MKAPIWASRSSRFSARPPPESRQSLDVSPTRSAPKSSRPTRYRCIAACRSSRTSPRTPPASSRFAICADPMSVGEYAALAHAAVDDLIEDRGAAVVAGGTGLYLRAALAELEIPPAVDASNRARAESLYDEDRHAAHARLSELDRDAAAAVHVNDRRRVVRSLELAEAGLSLVPSSDRLWSGLDAAPDARRRPRPTSRHAARQDRGSDRRHDPPRGRRRGPRRGTIADLAGARRRPWA